MSARELRSTSGAVSPQRAVTPTHRRGRSGVPAEAAAAASAASLVAPTPSPKRRRHSTRGPAAADVVDLVDDSSVASSTDARTPPRLRSRASTPAKHAPDAASTPAQLSQPLQEDVGDEEDEDVHAAAIKRERDEPQELNSDSEGDTEMRDADAIDLPPDAAVKREIKEEEEDEEDEASDSDVSIKEEEPDDGVGRHTRAAEHAVAASSDVAATAAAQPDAAPLYVFTDLSTAEARYIALLNGCPQHDVLRKLVGLIACPQAREDELIRDPLNAAKFFQPVPGDPNATSARNVRICKEFLRTLGKQHFCASFLVKLDNAQLLKYETNLAAYLAATGGVPPIDLTSMTEKLQNSRWDSVPVRDVEGFADCYPNSVMWLVVDLVCCIVNAVRMNPKTHIVHMQALDFAQQLYRRHLPALRKSIRVKADLEVCHSCGGATSDEDDVLGLLMQCESCGLWYHQRCAHVLQVPKEAFFCQPCLELNPRLSRNRSPYTTLPHPSRATPPVTNSPQPRKLQSPAPMDTSESSATAAAAAAAAKRKERQGAESPSIEANSKRQRTDAAPAPSSFSAYTNQNIRRRATSPQPDFPPSTSIAAQTLAPSAANGAAAAAAAATPLQSSSFVVGAPAAAAASARNNGPSSARSGRASPDGTWMRLLDFKVADRLKRGTQAPSAPTDARGEDEAELRAMRVDVDQAMRVLAASSERMLELQHRQRARVTKRQAQEIVTNSNVAACKRAVEMLAAPIEPHLAAAKSKVQHLVASSRGPSSAASPATDDAAISAVAAPSLQAPSPSAGATSAIDAPAATELLLAKYRQRHEATSHFIRSQSKQLAFAQEVAANSQQRLEELQAQMGLGAKWHSRQLLELENGLTAARRHLAEERRRNIESSEQAVQSRTLLDKVVQRLDNTQHGALIPMEFGSKLLAEVISSLPPPVVATQGNAARASAAGGSGDGQRATGGGANGVGGLASRTLVAPPLHRGSSDPDPALVQLQTTLVSLYRDWLHSGEKSLHTQMEAAEAQIVKMSGKNTDFGALKQAILRSQPPQQERPQQQPQPQQQQQRQPQQLQQQQQRHQSQQQHQLQRPSQQQSSQQPPQQQSSQRQPQQQPQQRQFQQQPQQQQAQQASRSPPLQAPSPAPVSSASSSPAPSPFPWSTLGSPTPLPPPPPTAQQQLNNLVSMMSGMTQMAPATTMMPFGLPNPFAVNLTAPAPQFGVNAFGNYTQATNNAVSFGGAPFSPPFTPKPPAAPQQAATFLTSVLPGLAPLSSTSSSATLPSSSASTPSSSSPPMQLPALTTNTTAATATGGQFGKSSPPAHSWTTTAATSTAPSPPLLAAPSLLSSPHAASAVDSVVPPNDTMLQQYQNYKRQQQQQQAAPQTQPAAPSPVGQVSPSPTGVTAKEPTLVTKNTESLAPAPVLAQPRAATPPSDKDTPPPLEDQDGLPPLVCLQP